MARGWESKSVEEQMAAREEARRPVPQVQPEVAERQRQRQSLELHRTRLMHDLEQAQNPRYRAQIAAALAHMDEKLAELD